MTQLVRSHRMYSSSSRRLHDTSEKKQNQPIRLSQRTETKTNQSPTDQIRHDRHQRTMGACCVGSTPNRALLATLAPENLSSGEKRAGCADSVRFPSGSAFCSRHATPTQAKNGEQGMISHDTSRKATDWVRFPSGSAFCSQHATPTQAKRRTRYDIIRHEKGRDATSYYHFWLYWEQIDWIK